MCNECSDGHLQRTLRLAEEGRRGAPPNPLVGAVITRENRVIATGYHAHYGGLHAEADALHAAGPAAEGSTLYCNLEPCSYTAPGKHQPPCTRHIIEAGVKRVVIGQLDPNPHVRGRGVQQLRDAGVQVVVTEEPGEYWRFNDVFNTVMALDRPMIHLKTAMSLDGRIATAGGDSKWITDEAARREAHQLRAQREAVAVGIGTVLTDDPSLTTRLVAGADPRPVVFDSDLRIPLESVLVRSRAAELIVVTRAETLEKRRERSQQLEGRGVTVVGVAAPEGGAAGVDLRDAHEDGAAGVDLPDAHEDGAEGVDLPDAHEDGAEGVDLPAAVGVLRQRFGIRSMLVEGGSHLVTAFVAADLFDRITAFLAPIIIGTGIPAIGDLGTSEIAAALRLEGVRWQRIGEQQMVDGYHPEWLSRVQAPIDERSIKREALHVHGTR